MNSKRLRPSLSVVAHGESLVSTAGGVLLCQTARVIGLDRALSKALAPWRAPLAVHDPGKIVADLAIAVALGGDCAADIALVRAQPEVFGPVASDPTVSRLIGRLAADEEAAVAAIRAARAAARDHAWRHAGVPRLDGLVVLDLDATLITAHSDKEWAAPTWKKSSGCTRCYRTPITASPVPGSRWSGCCAPATPAPTPPPTTSRCSMTRWPSCPRTWSRPTPRASGRSWCAPTPPEPPGLRRAPARAGRAVLLGAYLHHFDITRILDELPSDAWHPAVDADARPRDGGWVAEATAAADVSAWPAGTRLILRKERPHPGAQLRFTDADGHRITGFLTNSSGDDLAAPELRHRRHARVEDRIRATKDTGLRNLPFHDAAANQVWLEIAMLAADLIAHTQRLALSGGLRVAEPKRLRLTIFGVAGRVIRTARRHLLRIPTTWPWADAITSAHQHLAALAPP